MKYFVGCPQGQNGLSILLRRKAIGLPVAHARDLPESKLDEWGMTHAVAEVMANDCVWCRVMTREEALLFLMEARL